MSADTPGLVQRVTRRIRSDTAPDASPPTADLGLDETLDIVANARRRRTIDVLADVGGPVEFGDLVERVAALENDKPREELASQERKRVYIGMQQTHLGTLEEADVVTFDRKTGEIRRGAQFDGARRAVEAAREALGGEDA